MIEVNDRAATAIKVEANSRITAAILRGRVGRLIGRPGCGLVGLGATPVRLVWHLSELPVAWFELPQCPDRVGFHRVEPTPRRGVLNLRADHDLSRWSPRRQSSSKCLW